MFTTILTYVLWVGIALLAVMIVAGAYTLIAGRVPPPARWWGVPNWHTGQPLVRPRLLGLSQILWAGYMAAVLSLQGESLWRPRPEHEPELNLAGIAFLVTAAVVLIGVLVLAVVLSRRAYQPRAEEEG